MPLLDVSELNIVLGVLGAFILLHGLISHKIRQAWYLGSALPAVIVGIIIGPSAANFVNTARWGGIDADESHTITLGVTRVMIGLPLVIAGYQLPARYCWTRWREIAMCLLPIMTTMWLCTTLCILAQVPQLTLLSALAIASCVTCTDPVLSQAVAKGPFADLFVRRPLREIMSAEGGANDGFGFPFLMLAIFLMRHADSGFIHQDAMDVQERVSRAEASATTRESVGDAIRDWFLETWLYIIILSLVYGSLLGFIFSKAIRFCHGRKWVDNESYLLLPTALGLFIVGTCGLVGTDDSMACFAAGCALNWDGHYLRETHHRRDEVNSSVHTLLQLGGFCYIGTILPWDQFNDPDGTGLTYGRLFLLGIMVLLFRRIPALLLSYKIMPSVCSNWKEALFMGYFGPIGAGSVFYVEHARHTLEMFGEGDAESDVIKVMIPVVYWLVFFSIVVHGLSIPVLDFVYRYLGVKPVHDDAVEIRRVTSRDSVPVNAVDNGRGSFIVYNRFSRPSFDVSELPVIMGVTPSGRSSTSDGEDTEDVEMERKSSEREADPRNMV